MEPGESPQVAAQREFIEETGLTPSPPLTHLVTQDYSYWKDGRTICHRRHYFHVALAGELQQTWLHHEMTPDSGGPPIRFRFFWLGIDGAGHQLGYGMRDALHLV